MGKWQSYLSKQPRHDLAVMKLESWNSAPWLGVHRALALIGSVKKQTKNMQFFVYLHIQLHELSSDTRKESHKSQLLTAMHYLDLIRHGISVNSKVG